MAATEATGAAGKAVTPTEVVTKAAVVLDYADLSKPTEELRDRIEAAFGYDGLGIIAITNVPGYLEKREALLPRARELAHLPAEALKQYEHEASHYSVGWSHGKEIFEGKPDFAKGSFYANPLHDKPVDDEELIKKYPAFLEPNIWPTEHIPALEGAFKDLGNLIVSVGRQLAVHCDGFVAGKVPGYPADRLSKLLKESRMCKARLLYYFPRSEEEAKAAAEKEASLPPMDAISSWCGWHNDHGSLTGLCQAMYTDEAAGGKEIPNPDPSAGLYIRSRQHELVKLQLPPGCLAFQIGESAQIHTGGALQATPHSVRAAGQANVGRATLAVFMEPEWDEPMAPPSTEEEAVAKVTQGAKGETLPPGVPALDSRWNPTMDFGEFTHATLSAYY